MFGVSRFFTKYSDVLRKESTHQHSLSFLLHYMNISLDISASPSNTIIAFLVDPFSLSSTVELEWIHPRFTYLEHHGRQLTSTRAGPP